MNFKESFVKAINIIKLDENAILDVSKDKEAWKMGLLIIVIGGLLSGIATYFQSIITPDIIELVDVGTLSIIMAPIGAIIGTLIGTGIILLIIKIFRGSCTFKELFTVMAFASLLSWLSILNLIPNIGGIINFVAGIWSLIVLVVIIRALNSFSTGKAVLIVLIPVILVLIIAVVIAVVAALFIGSAFIT
jgi:hypothetical protein